MINNSYGIHLLERQIANDEDICCSCGNISSFPKAFFDNYHVADVGIIVHVGLVFVGLRGCGV